MEELAAKYAGAYASDFELPDTPSSTEVESDGDDEDQMTSSDEEIEQGEYIRGVCQVGVRLVL